MKKPVNSEQNKFFINLIHTTALTVTQLVLGSLIYHNTQWTYIYMILSEQKHAAIKCQHAKKDHRYYIKRKQSCYNIMTIGIEHFFHKFPLIIFY